MDCYLVIFAFIIFLAYIHSKHKKKRKVILEGNINTKGKLGLVKFSNKSQK